MSCVGYAKIVTYKRERNISNGPIFQGTQLNLVKSNLYYILHLFSVAVFIVVVVVVVVVFVVFVVVVVVVVVFETVSEFIQLQNSI